MATPEYMPPEVIEMFSSYGKQAQTRSQIEILSMIDQPWSVDMWSLGCVIVELLTGIPHWLCYKCRVTLRGRDIVKPGLFAVKGQDYDKILQKQRHFCENIGTHLREPLGMFDDHQSAEQLIDLLERMMRWQPQERISPKEMLEHDFLRET